VYTRVANKNKRFKYYLYYIGIMTKQPSLTVYMTPEEKAKVEIMAKEKGFKASSAFVYNLIFGQNAQPQKVIPQTTTPAARSRSLNTEMQEMTNKIIEYLKRQPSQEAFRYEIYRAIPVSQDDKLLMMRRKRALDRLINGRAAQIVEEAEHPANDKIMLLKA
jgi:hypothetical protein